MLLWRLINALFLVGKAMLGEWKGGRERGGIRKASRMVRERWTHSSCPTAPRRTPSQSPRAAVVSLHEVPTANAQNRNRAARGVLIPLGSRTMQLPTMPLPFIQ